MSFPPSWVWPWGRGIGLLYGKWSHLSRRKLPLFSKLLCSPAFPPGRQRAPVARVFLGSWISVAALFWVFLNLFNRPWCFTLAAICISLMAYVIDVLSCVYLQFVRSLVRNPFQSMPHVIRCFFSFLFFSFLSGQTVFVIHHEICASLFLDSLSQAMNLLVCRWARTTLFLLL